MMTPAALAALQTTYRDGLLADTIPFWLRHGLDRECGGLLTGLDRDGTVVDTDKALWLQGRAAWTFATPVNAVERRPEWLDASRHCLDFIRQHGRGPEGKLYFTVTREGKPLRMRRYVYSEAFACIGSAAYAKASVPVLFIGFILSQGFKSIAPAHVGAAIRTLLANRAPIHTRTGRWFGPVCAGRPAEKINS